MFHSVAVNSELRIVRLGGGDTLKNEMYQDDLRRLVEMIDDQYPGIDVWYNRKVLPGLKEKQRFAYIVYSHNQPVGSTIIRKGENAKLCSMRILPQWREKGIGDLLMALLGKEIRRFAGKVHFTAPLSTYEDHKPFFDKLGFQYMAEASRQYRLFDKEILCTVNAKVLWKNVLNDLENTIEKSTLTGNFRHPDLVMSIRPEFADRIKQRKKKVEIRRKFSKKWKGTCAMLYASAPLCEFFGEAQISDIVRSKPKEIWKLFGPELGVGEVEYYEYCKGVEEVTALVLSEIDIYKSGILKDQIEFLLNKELRAPQSYCAIKEGTTWPTAVSLNYLLLA